MAENPTMKIANRLFKPLLRSPLHFLASHGLMLITVTGRKTGQPYTTPVAYLREGGTVYFFSGLHLAWTKNLREGAPVKLILKGREVAGSASPCFDEPETRQRMLKRLYPYFSQEKTDGLGLFKVIL
jgi:deazaflavin-dependent oxidoreductase (nitroreductase family)